jgi:hypothetical protein
MNQSDLDHECRRRLRDEAPDIAELVATAVDCAELAALAAAMPSLFGLWGVGSLALQRGFREAVRDRYAALMEERGAATKLR